MRVLSKDLIQSHGVYIFDKSKRDNKSSTNCYRITNANASNLKTIKLAKKVGGTMLSKYEDRGNISARYPASFNLDKGNKCNTEIISSPGKKFKISKNIKNKSIESGNIPRPNRVLNNMQSSGNIEFTK